MVASNAWRSNKDFNLYVHCIKIDYVGLEGPKSQSKISRGKKNHINAVCEHLNRFVLMYLSCVYVVLTIDGDIDQSTLVYKTLALHNQKQNQLITKT